MTRFGSVNEPNAHQSGYDPIRLTASSGLEYGLRVRYLHRPDVDVVVVQPWMCSIGFYSFQKQTDHVLRIHS